MLTLCVVPAVRSRTKTSPVVLLSPATRFGALELNVTKRPLSLMKGLRLDPMP